jgi:hypothetical protein
MWAFLFCDEVCDEVCVVTGFSRIIVWPLGMLREFFFRDLIPLTSKIESSDEVVIGDTVKPNIGNQKCVVLYRENDIHHSLLLTNPYNSYCLMRFQSPRKHENSCSLLKRLVLLGVSGCCQSRSDWVDVSLWLNQSVSDAWLMTYRCGIRWNSKGLATLQTTIQCSTLLSGIFQMEC